MATVDPDRLRKCEEIRKRLEAELPDHVARSRASAADLKSLIESAGSECGDLPFDVEGLGRVEVLLHRVARRDIETPREEFERLAGYFLAECLIEQAHARWDIHDICTERWIPHILLFAGEAKLGVFRLVEAVYEKGASSRPKRALTKLLRDFSS